MIVAEHLAFVVGIDTHAKTHTLAIINTPSGGEISNETFPATSAGGNRALSWILRRTCVSTEQVLLSMEGTGSYGAKLRQQASDAGSQVTEAPIPNQRLGRYQRKSDSMDAARAARAVLSIPMDRLNKPINTIALIRINRDPDTREYVARRTSQGRIKKEIIRSLSLSDFLVRD